MAASPLRELRDIVEPYPGLRPFEPWESEIFFGRQAHTQRLIEILRERAFLAVIGPSGSGKSSLVRAGLLSELPRGRLGTGTRWRVAILRPGNEPIRRLARALTQRDVLGPSLLRDDAIPAGPDHHTVGVSVVEAELRRGPMALVQVAQTAARRERPPGADDADVGTPSANLLILVDQFEELFTYLDAGGQERHDDLAREAEAFVSLLLTARTVPSARVFVVMTMRTDFLGQCTRFLDLPDAINRSQYLTPRLSRDEVEMAIVGPARHFGGDVDATLVNELINEVGTDPDQLPLLQHALSRMWHFAADRTKRVDPTIENEDFALAGGVRSALSKHAEEVLAGLSGAKTVGDILTVPQQAARQLLLAITEQRSAEGGGQTVRRPQSLARIAEWTTVDLAQLSQVVRSFAAPLVNFLHYDQSDDAGEVLPPETVIDVSHEAFVRQWQRLRDWIAEESRRAADYGRLLEKAQEYEQGQAGAGLLSGAGLARAIEWLNDAGVGDGWRPTLPWARRYATDVSKSDSRFTSVCDYVRNSDRRRREDALLEQQQLEHRRSAEEQERERQRRVEEADRERRAAAALAQERQGAAEALAAAALQRTNAAMELVATQTRAASYQRRLIGILAMLLLVALGLALWAIDERNGAELLRKRAEGQALWAPIGFEDGDLSVRAQDGLIAVARAPNDVATEFVRLATEDEAYARNFVKAPAPLLVATVGPSPQARDELLRLVAARKGAAKSPAGDAKADRPSTGGTATALAAAIVEFALVDQPSADDALVSMTMTALVAYLSDKEIDSSESWWMPADLTVQLDTWVSANRVVVVRRAVEEQWRQSSGRSDDAFPWLAALAMSCETIAPATVIDVFEALGQSVRKLQSARGVERALLSGNVISAPALEGNQLRRLDRASAVPHLISRVAACLTDAQALDQVKRLFPRSEQGLEAMDTVAALLSRPPTKQQGPAAERVQVAEHILNAVLAAQVSERPASTRVDAPLRGLGSATDAMAARLRRPMASWAQQLDSSQVQMALGMLLRYLEKQESEGAAALALAALNSLVDRLDAEGLARVNRVLSASEGQGREVGRSGLNSPLNRVASNLQRKVQQLLDKPENGATRNVDELLRKLAGTIWPDELEILGGQMAAQIDRMPVAELENLANRLIAARKDSGDNDQEQEYDRLILLLVPRLTPEQAAAVRPPMFEQLKAGEPDVSLVTGYLALAQRGMTSGDVAHLVAKELLELLRLQTVPNIGLANPAALRQIVGRLPKQEQETIVREVLAKAVSAGSARVSRGFFDSDGYPMWGKLQSSPTEGARSLGEFIAAVSDPDARIRLRGELLDQMLKVPSVLTAEIIGTVLQVSLGMAPSKAAVPAASAVSAAPAAAAVAPELAPREWSAIWSQAVERLGQADRAVEARALAKLIRGAAGSVSDVQQRDSNLIELLKYPSAAPLETMDVIRQLHKAANPPAAADGYWASITWLKNLPGSLGGAGATGASGNASLLDAPAARE